MLLTSVIISVLSSLIATVLGTAASIGMHDMKPRLRSMYMTVTNIPMTNPDIVTGVSLALLFAFAGTLLKMQSVLGFVLGCTPRQAFFKVVLHEIMPGVISGALMAFTMSLDDFVISYFVYGPKFVTLPVEIYNYTKKPLQPKIYALFTLLFMVILLVMIVMTMLEARDEKQQTQRRIAFRGGRNRKEVRG